MSDDRTVEEQKIIEFLALYAQDREAGREHDLAHYLALFPGHEEALSREYLRLTGRVTSWDEDGGEGERFGPYRLLAELGGGGQGRVHLALDTRLGRRVALKVLRAPLAEGVQDSRFRREALLASRLDHPGICGVYEIGEVGGVAYFSMRHVEGTSLARLLAAARAEREAGGPGVLELPAAADEASGSRSERAENGLWRGEGRRLMAIVLLVEKAARALERAHEAGIVHRDIKPGNLMVTPEGEPVLLDFGLAREDGGEGGDLTLTGDLCGTPAYMSPEQIDPAGGRPDRRTDIWSLGVLLYECLTLERPFAAPTREGLFARIRNQQPLPPRRLEREIPRDLQAVLAVALAKEPGRRYQSALDLAEDLRRVRSLEPITVRPPGPLYRAWRWARRNRGLAASLAALFLLLVAGLVAAGLAGRREHRLRNLAEERYRHLRRLSGSYLHDLHDRLLDIPGALPAREEMLARALRYLELLAPAAGADKDELLRDRVTAHMKIGDLLGNMQFANLGRIDEAHAHYARARELAGRLVARRPGDRQAALLLARVRRGSAAVLEVQDGLAKAREMVRRAQALLAELEPGPDLLPLKAALHLDLGRLLLMGGSRDRTRQAMEQARLAMALAGELEGEDPSHRMVGVRARLDLAHFLLQARRGGEARGLLEKARDLLEGLPSVLRTGFRGQVAFASCCLALGRLDLGRSGSREEAEELIERGVAILESLVRQEPHNENARRRLAEALMVRGSAYSHRGLEEKALALYGRVRRLLGEGAAAKWRNRAIGQVRVRVNLMIAEIHYERLRHDRALAGFARALAEADRLAAADPTNHLAARQAAICRLYLGKVELRRGRGKEARRWLLAALEDYDRLARTDPQSAALQAGRLNLLQNLAMLADHQGEHGEAAERYRAALALNERSRGREGAVDFKAGLLERGLAQVLAKAGRDEESLRAWEEAERHLAAAAAALPRDHRVLRNLLEARLARARHHYTAGETGQALAFCGKALATLGTTEPALVEQDPKLLLALAGAHLVRGLCLHRRGEAERARSAAEKAREMLERAPAPVQARFPLRRALQELEKSLAPR